MGTDWSDVLSLCHRRSALLDRNDVYPSWAFDEVGPVKHKDSCWLGKNYADQPEVWKYGCDQGCIKEAMRERGAARG